MSKKTFMASIILVLLASTLNGALFVNMTKANPIPNEQISPPPIVIQSPLNTTYDQNDIPLNFTVVGASEYYPMTYKLSYIYYVCDGESHNNPFGMTLDKDQYCTNLTGLSKGQHTLTVHAEGVGSYYITSTQWTQYTISSVQTVAFTVTKNLPTLVVTINSPLNQTYTTDSVKVNVSAYDISKAIVGMSYVMDIYYEPYWVGSVTFYSNEPKFVSDGVNFSHIGNGTTTMTNLVNGPHHMILTIREWMMDYSDTTFDIYFTVQKSTQEPTASSEISPTLSPAPSPTPTLKPNPTLSPSPTPSPSPTQQPTPEPSLTPDRLQVGDFAPVLIPASMIFSGIFVVGLLVYFRKRRG